MSKCRLTTPTLIALAAIFAMASGTVQAQVKPFQVTGGGTADHIPAFRGDESTHWAEGHATELGEYYCQSVVRLDDFTSQTTGDFSNAAPCVFTAANGDDLVFNYAGSVELIPTEEAGVFIAKWTAIFTPVPDLCTGRFAKITDGSVRMVAITDPFEFGEHDVPYTWSGEGWIEFAEPKGPDHGRDD